jgi:hypothetical protein
MAKKIYVVALANGSVVEAGSKKAVRELEGIVSVTVDGADVTADFVEAPTEYVEAVEAIEAVEEAQAEVEALEGPVPYILFTASRGNAQRLTWRQAIVNPDDELVKVRGCAALLPTQVAEAIGSDKFVSYIPQAMLERSVAEGKPVRGLASTVSDVFNRYTKVLEIKGADRIETALGVFAEVLEAIDGGVTEGEWARPEPEVPELPEAPQGEGEVEAA